MAEIVTISRVCDRHQARSNKQVEAEVTRVTIDGEEFDVDWCPECKKALTEKLLDELRHYGRLVNGKRKRPELTAVKEPAPAQLPKAPKKPKAIAAASNGKATSSGKNKRAVDPNRPRRYPCLWCDWKPFTSDTGMMLHGQGKHNLATLSVVEVFGLTCPLCGEEVTSSLGGHAAKGHDGATLPELFEQARKDGDPHGIVEKVLAKGTP